MTKPQDFTAKLKRECVLLDTATARPLNFRGRLLEQLWSQHEDMNFGEIQLLTDATIEAMQTFAFKLRRSRLG